jgi:predicted amidohydrolase
MHIQLGQPQLNLDQATSLIKEAAAGSSQLILLPELWTTGYDLSNGRRLAQENRLVLAEIARLSNDYSISIGGSVMLEKDTGIYNTFLLYSPNAPEPVVYQKIHLFRLMQEDSWLAPGDHLQTLQADWGKAGLAICYDLRFPEMFRRLALEGAELFLLSAEWPLRRIAHWQTLLRARAIENQCFVAAVNCVGEIGGETFGGSSAIISPWGETLVEGNSNQPGLFTAVIEMSQVVQVRQTIPVFKDRRPDLYG